MDVLLGSADGPERPLVLEAEGCKHVIIPFTRAITPVQDLNCLRVLVQLMREYRPDIVHTHTPKAGLLGMLAAKLAGVPIRIHTIAGLPFMTATGRKRQLLIAMEKLTYAAAQHVWPNSDSIMSYMQTHQLCPERKLSMIGQGSTNGIDLEVFSPAAVRTAARTAAEHLLDYRADANYLMAVGRVVRDKGIPEVLTAFRQLKEDFPDLRLVLIGPIERERPEETLGEEDLRTIAEDRSIIHIEWTDDVAAFLDLADVLVHASHREGFPNVPLQAGAMKCPIVCSAIPGNIDIVSNGETGLSFPVGDTQALRICLQEALTNRPRMRHMAEALRHKVETQFDRRVIHGLILDRYRALLTAKGR